MKGNRVITIGRECGSHGRVIGNKLAEKLGVKCYDKELLSLAAKESGLAEELFEAHDEKPTRSFLYSMVMDSYAMGYSTSSFADMPLNHKVFLAQFETIKNLASKESCVIVGRCADYALADYPNVTSVFITGNMEDKIRNICEAYGLDEAKAKDVITKTDKKRANYYNYYSSKSWGDARSYDLCLNSSLVGVDGAVDSILHFVSLKEKLADSKEAAKK